MIIDELLQSKGMTKHQLAVDAGIPHTTLNDICSGRTKLEKCRADTVYKLAKALNVSAELLIESGLQATQRERLYEHDLPGYLQHDLDAYKDGLAHGSTVMDCLWGELYGSINMAEISDGAISPAHADYLRKKYLWGTL